METAEPDLSAELLALDNQLCFAVYSANHAITRMYKPLLDRLGVTYPQYLVLLVLWERDSVRVGEIGERLMLETNTLTPLLKRLETLGLVDRQRSPQDERRVIVSLTDKGRNLRGEAARLPERVFAASGCSVPEVQELRGALVALRDRLRARSGE
ncbi:MarR family winged helix-turn-helix transcriptional regulator [Stakelama pacifica]|uniref:MarR family transcriptional regulator n=1 Tax=Stakelama pacifica TaxID=517720 RepID=A0A4R6FPM0_9SPHN|nr:MarR family transcriptional regulator [Stakelama pacifica]TDN83609.1 MarR family transcriptional regulator [Stakelama pacifica]GGO94313.1 transcriptional regulator [Stakelama pacifica]